MPLALPVEHESAALRPMSAWEQLVADYDLLDLSPRYHPLGLLRPHLPAHLATTADLDRLPDGALIQLAGLVVCRQRPATAKGVTFLLVEDERGLANIIVYPRLYEAARLTVRGEPFLVVEGTLRKQEGTINIIARRVFPLETARRAPRAQDTQPRDDAVRHPEPDPEPQRALAAVAPEAHNYR